MAWCVLKHTLLASLHETLARLAAVSLLRVSNWLPKMTAARAVLLHAIPPSERIRKAITAGCCYLQLRNCRACPNPASQPCDAANRFAAAVCQCCFKSGRAAVSPSWPARARGAKIKIFHNKPIVTSDYYARSILQLVTLSPRRTSSKMHLLFANTICTILLLNIVQLTSGFKCYVCDSKIDNECVENLPKNSKLQPQECKDLIEPKYCIKTTNMYAGE